MNTKVKDQFNQQRIQITSRTCKDLLRRGCPQSEVDSLWRKTITQIEHSFEKSSDEEIDQERESWQLQPQDDETLIHKKIIISSLIETQIKPHFASTSEISKENICIFLQKFQLKIKNFIQPLPNFLSAKIQILIKEVVNRIQLTSEGYTTLYNIGWNKTHRQWFADVNSILKEIWVITQKYQTNQFQHKINNHQLQYKVLDLSNLFHIYYPEVRMHMINNHKNLLQIYLQTDLEINRYKDSFKELFKQQRKSQNISIKEYATIFPLYCQQNTIDFKVNQNNSLIVNKDIVFSEIYKLETKLQEIFIKVYNHLKTEEIKNMSPQSYQVLIANEKDIILNQYLKIKNDQIIHQTQSQKEFSQIPTGMPLLGNDQRGISSIKSTSVFDLQENIKIKELQNQKQESINLTQIQMKEMQNMVKLKELELKEREMNSQLTIEQWNIKQALDINDQKILLQKEKINNQKFNQQDKLKIEAYQTEKHLALEEDRQKKQLMNIQALLEMKMYLVSVMNSQNINKTQALQFVRSQNPSFMLSIEDIRDLPD